MTSATDKSSSLFSYPLLSQNSSSNAAGIMGFVPSQHNPLADTLPVPQSLNVDLPPPSPPTMVATRASRILNFVVGLSSPSSSTTSSGSAPRSFFLSESVVAPQSALVAKKLSNPEYTTDTFYLPTTPTSAFQNFVDYAHSSIYSPNIRAPDFDHVRTHMEAWILGNELKSTAYQDAAAIKLHSIFSEAHRNLPIQDQFPTMVQGVGKNMSPITARDIEYVCTYTAPSSLLRALLFDAVASHWTQFEVINIGNDLNIDQGIRWIDVYNQFGDFRSTLALSLRASGAQRVMFLGGVGEYIHGKGIGGKVVKKTEERGRIRKKRSRRSAGNSVAARAEGRLRNDSPSMRAWMENRRWNGYEEGAEGAKNVDGGAGNPSL